MSAINELQHLLDERGVEFKTHDTIIGKAVTWHGSVCDWVALPDEKGLAVGVYKDYLTPERAVAATLGCSTLTADMLFDAIYKHGVYDGFVLSVGRGSLPAIADQLNAALDDGECKNDAGRR